jgi:hypothetical protein
MAKNMIFKAQRGGTERKRATSVWLALIALSAVSACSNSVASMSCSEVASEAIRISEGEIVAINNRTEVSKNDQRLVCRGTALTKAGDETPLRFEAIKSDDGDIVIKYDDDEHQAALESNQRQQLQREWARTEREVEQTVDRMMEDARHEAYVATH